MIIVKVVYISSTASGMFSQSIYFDLLQEFIKNGHEVYCVYAEEKRDNMETRSFSIEGIEYLGIKTGNVSKNPNLISKGLATLTIDKLFIKGIKSYWGDIDFDLILHTSPPITFIKTLEYFKKKNIPIYLMLKDIFPQNAIDLRLFRRKGLIHRSFLKMEKRTYDLSDYIGVMSPKNKEFLLENNPRLKGKIGLLPNSIAIKKDKVQLKSRCDLGLPEDKVLYLYGGNLGIPQSPDFIIECIKEMETIDNSNFIICGWGAETNKITNYIKKNNIKNTLYLGSKDVETFNQITLACDVGLIFLDFKFTIPNFPQRLLSYLDASLPVICATDTVSDIGQIAETNEFGYFVESIDSKAWRKKVLKLSNNSELRKKMGQNGNSFLKDNYDVSIAYNTIVEQIKG